MENLIQRSNQSELFFPKSGHFFRFSKRAEKTSPAPPPPPLSTASSCAPVSVAKYASILLNIPKYPWKRWINCSEYAWTSYMFDRLLKRRWVLNKPRFWLWQCCICKSYAEFLIYLIMAPYASVRPEYPLMSLNMSECP